MKPEEEQMELLQEYYEDHKEEIIEQFRIDTEPSETPEDDETLESWYKPILLEMSKDWYEQDQANDKYIRGVK